MTFIQYYNSLTKQARRDLRREIMIKGKVNSVSVYNWTCKPINPHPLVQDVIAKIIGKPPRELFP
jgi:hypothetical protein